MHVCEDTAMLSRTAKQQHNLQQEYPSTADKVIKFALTHDKIMYIC